MGKTPNPKLADKNWLQEQYLVQKKSLRTIAKEIGVTTAVVSKYAKRYSISLRNRGESRACTIRSKNSNKTLTICKKYPQLQDRDWLYQKYIVEGLSMRQIVELIGISNRRLLKRALKYHSIPIRSLKDARHNRTIHGRTKKAPNPIIVQNEDHIVDSYKNGESIRSIRKRLGLSRDAVHKLLTSKGVILRSSGEANIGRKHSKETLIKMSQTASTQILNGIRSSHVNGRRVNCLTPHNGFVTMRSTWEKKYAEYLKSQGIDFYYEPRSFQLSNGKSYVVDFYLPDTQTFVEIKGFLSEDQSEKYQLFKSEYPDLKWQILGKEDLINMGIDLKTKIQTIYLLIGAPGSGKSWVANQLTDKFCYVSYDNNPKKDHLTLLRAPSDKPKLYDPTFKISTFIRRHSDEFDIKIVAIQENEQTLRERIASRGGTWTETILKRNEQVRKRFEKYGADGFIGSSDECLAYLKSVL